MDWDSFNYQGYVLKCYDQEISYANLQSYAALLFLPVFGLLLNHHMDRQGALPRTYRDGLTRICVWIHSCDLVSGNYFHEDQNFHKILSFFSLPYCCDFALLLPGL